MQHQREKDIIVVRLEDGEDLFEMLKRVTEYYSIDSGIILSGVGTFKNCKLSYYTGKTRPDTRVLNGLLEVISLSGNISRVESRVFHLHVLLADYKNCYGGHLNAGTISNTLELAILKLSEVRMTRRKEESGLMGLYLEKGVEAQELPGLGLFQNTQF